MKLTKEIIAEWMMYNGEDFYIDGPLTNEIQDKILEPFKDALFEKAPTLVDGTKEQFESFYDFELTDEAHESEENLNKIAVIFCEVVDEVGVSTEIFNLVRDEFAEELQEIIADSAETSLGYMKEDAPTMYNIVKEV